MLVTHSLRCAGGSCSLRHRPRQDRGDSSGDGGEPSLGAQSRRHVPARGPGARRPAVPVGQARGQLPPAELAARSHDEIRLLAALPGRSSAWCPATVSARGREPAGMVHRRPRHPAAPAASPSPPTRPTPPRITPTCSQHSGARGVICSGKAAWQAADAGGGARRRRPLVHPDGAGRAGGRAAGADAPLGGSAGAAASDAPPVDHAAGAAAATTSPASSTPPAPAAGPRA